MTATVLPNQLHCQLEPVVLDVLDVLDVRAETLLENVRVCGLPRRTRSERCIRTFCPAAIIYPRS